MTQEQKQAVKKLIDQRGITWLLGEMLELYDELHGVKKNRDYYNYYIDLLKLRYQSVVIAPHPTQIDLEDAISSIKNDL